MPLLPPVTSATFPSSLLMFLLLCRTFREPGNLRRAARCGGIPCALAFTSASRNAVASNGVDHGLRVRDRNHVRCAGNHDGRRPERGPEQTGGGARCEECPLADEDGRRRR